MPLHKQTVDVAALVKETAGAFKPLAAENNIDLRVELLGTQPHILVDPARIRQALHNLLSNALVYTPKRGQICVRVERRGAVCTIQVQDSGTGIDPAQLPTVFDRFYPSKGARGRDRAGTGLGLAIVKAIVEAHGGSVTVASPGLGQGSTLAIYLPVERERV